MILIVGASGRLGRSVARMLLADGRQVRVMTRDRERVDDLARMGAEVAIADPREPASLRQALRGVGAVFAATHGYPAEDDDPCTTDDLGMRCLIAVARAAGVAHFVFTSALGARPSHPVDFVRIKYGIEKHLRESVLGYTILRPSAFMESTVESIVGQIAARGRLTIVGRGDKPISFVAVDDVARLATRVLENQTPRGEVIAIGGPENLSLLELAAVVERGMGRAARKRYLSVPAARALWFLSHGLNLRLSRDIADGLYLATTDLRFDSTEALERFTMEPTHLADVASGLALAPAVPMQKADRRLAGRPH